MASFESEPAATPPVLIGRYYYRRLPQAGSFVANPPSSCRKSSDPAIDPAQPLALEAASNTTDKSEKFFDHIRKLSPKGQMSCHANLPSRRITSPSVEKRFIVQRSKANRHLSACAFR
jgi:hypothetical protein